ncbi:hypothetical protein EIP91_000614 [Steccherinum ochraceum]|uniref:Uncharacterized protein n=1 Tax=Steccherinum ochraceum TaxID=92696 RepID=A0A4R0RIW8_9APHY|nr:hypothetical protein EIP91_000614 [Steccherinum ochraceum]
MPEPTAIFRPDDCEVTIKVRPTHDSSIADISLRVTLRRSDARSRASGVDKGRGASDGERAGKDEEEDGDEDMLNDDSDGDEDMEDEDEWTDEESTTEEVIARITGFKIQRAMHRDEFLSSMEEPTQEMHDVATTLFDLHGMLKPEFVQSEWHKGSGCFGSELSHGTIIYVEDMHVKPEYRTQGLGSWAMQRLLASEHLNEYGFVILLPGRTCDQGPEAKLSKAQCDDLFKKTTAFFYKNGFRRIGRTVYLGYSGDPKHPSRQLAVADDVPTNAYNTYGNAEESRLNIVAEGGGGLGNPPFPLHRGIALASLKDANPSQPPLSQPIDAFIAFVHARKPAIIHRQDSDGLTPLHVAARVMNPLAVATLLDLAFTGAESDLDRRDNVDGLTPLEAVEFEMRKQMEHQVGVFSWDQQPYPENGLRCAYMLRKAMGEAVGTAEAYLKLKQWGCTCGQCTDGWFSPRLRYRMHNQAEMIWDLMEMDEYIRSLPGCQDHVLSTGVDCIPPHLLSRADEAFHQGFRAVIYSIALALRMPDASPSKALVQAWAAQDAATKPYFRQGGLVDYAMDYIFNYAQDQSLLGDCDWDDTMAEVVADCENHEWTTLPVCQNDLNFRLARARIGLRKARPGPYFVRTVLQDEDSD